MGQGERGPSPERLRTIALNRLRALGIASWISQGWARGRLVINPDRFKHYPGVRLIPEQDFAVYQHAFLAFPAPSPLQHLGGIRFYEEESLHTLLASIERRWAALIAGTEAALVRARVYCSEAKLDPASWMIEVAVADRIGRVVFRFDGRLAILYVHSVDGSVLEYGPKAPPIALQLPAEPLAIDDDVLAPYVREARARVGLELEREDTGRISLDLISTDLASLREDGAVVANPTIASGDLDIDLDALKTGDLKVYPKEEEQPPPLETVQTGHQLRRHPREPQNVPAKMTWDDGEADVVLADVSAGGVFAHTTVGTLPKHGEQVRISGFGKLSVAGQVAFVRPNEEAELFPTGGGIGISFVLEPWLGGVRANQEAPVCAIFLKDWDTRRRALSAVDEARALPWTADTLVELAVMTLHLDVKLVVVDESSAERVNASLGLEDRGIAILAVRNASDPIDASKIRRRLTTPE